MQRRTTPAAELQSHEDVLPSQCSACGVLVLVHLREGEVESGSGDRCPVSYADADICVWDCAACGGANAEAFGEV